MNEFEIINKYFSPLSLKNKGSFNLKDDTFFDYKKKIAISVDTYIEKKHFINFNYPELLIKKIFRCALSDLVCKGITPQYYFISVSGNKKNFNKKNLNLINKSLNSEQKKFKTVLVGGDTTNSGILSFTFVMVGYSKNKPILRNTAKINDDIYVTGNLGDSFIGLKVLQKKIKLNKVDQKYFKKAYYNPQLQALFSKKLNSFANSSIDISDGLYQDLNHILKKNNLSCYIDISKIPISNKLKILLAKKKINKLNVISQGDDYQILFTSHKKNRTKINRISKMNRTKITRIGTIKSKNRKKILNCPKNIGYIHNF